LPILAQTAENIFNVNDGIVYHSADGNGQAS
jgi:hypothetical protein